MDQSGRRQASRLCVAFVFALVVLTSGGALGGGVLVAGAAAQAISPSAGCTAANAGTYDLTTNTPLVPLVNNFTDDFTAGEVLTFTTNNGGGGFVTSRADDVTAGVTVFSSIPETTVNYSIPETGARNFSLALETEPDFATGEIALACTPAQGDITITKDSDIDGDFNFSGDLGDFTITIGGEPASQSFPGVFAGSYVVSEIAGADTELESIVCTGDNDNGTIIDVAAGQVTIDLDAGENIQCTFTNRAPAPPAPGAPPVNPTSADIAVVSNHVIRNFLYRRSSQMLNEQPDRASITRKNPDRLWSDAVDLSVQASSGGVDARAGASSNGAWGNRLDVWVEGRYASYRYDNQARSEGDFGVVYLGVDYLVSDKVLIGALGQVDWTSETTPIVGEDVDGNGWMAGPYLSAQLDQNLYFDARAAWGRSSNTLSIEGFTGDDDFDTSRWLLQGALTGNRQFGAWRLTPTAIVSYIEEHQDAYTSGTGAFISEQTVALGRVSFEPELAWRRVTQAGVVIEPHVRLAGLWDFESPNGLSIPGWTVTTDDVRMRAEAGLYVGFQNGFGLRAAGGYDGIGAENYHAYSARLWLDVPFGRRSAPKPKRPTLKTCADGSMVAMTDACPPPPPPTMRALIAFKPGKAALSEDGAAALRGAWNDASAYDVTSIVVDPATSDSALAEQRMAAIEALLSDVGAPPGLVAPTPAPGAQSDMAEVTFNLR